MADRMSKERRAEIRDNCERGGGGYPGRLIPANDALALLDEVERLEAERDDARAELARVREVAGDLLDRCDSAERIVIGEYSSTIESDEAAWEKMRADYEKRLGLDSKS